MTKQANFAVLTGSLASAFYSMKLDMQAYAYMSFNWATTTSGKHVFMS